MERNISFETLRQAYFQAANIVAKHGDRYLPIFERLEQEYEVRKNQLNAVNRAIQVTKNLDDQHTMDANK